MPHCLNPVFRSAPQNVISTERILSAGEPFRRRQGPLHCTGGVFVGRRQPADMYSFAGHPNVVDCCRFLCGVVVLVVLGVSIAELVQWWWVVIRVGIGMS